MKICNTCGSQLDDGVKFCTSCGAALPDESATMNNVYAGYDNAGYQNQAAGYANMGYQNQPMGYDNTGYQNQQYSNATYQNAEAQTEKPKKAKKQKGPKKPVNKKKVVIISIASVVLLALIVVGIFLFGGRLTKGKATKLVKEYIAAIEDKDVVGVIEKTVPEELVNNVIDELNKEYDLDEEFHNFDDYDEYDELIDALEDELEDEDIEDELDEVDIEFSNIEVTKVKRFDLESYISRVEKEVEDLTGEEFDILELVENIADEEVTVSDIEKELIEISEDYGFKITDLKDIYVVDCSFEVEVKYDGDKWEFDSEEIMSNHVLVYKYDGEWYLVPAGAAEGAVLPSFVRYEEKSKMSNDISSCDTIETAVNTALGNESINEYLTADDTVITLYPGKEFCGDPYTLAESGAAVSIAGGGTGDFQSSSGKSVAECQDMFINDLGCSLNGVVPNIKYNRDPNTGEEIDDLVFYVYVSAKGSVEVYIGPAGKESSFLNGYDPTMDVLDGDDGIYEICPSVCDSYQ